MLEHRVNRIIGALHNRTTNRHGRLGVLMRRQSLDILERADHFRLQLVALPLYKVLILRVPQIYGLESDNKRRKTFGVEQSRTILLGLLEDIVKVDEAGILL